jgi:hypothetical protein
MTRIPDESQRNSLPPDDEKLFDLLADGELEDARRRELLGGLDDRPGGWRRCALAFLEAQSWRRELGTLSREPLSPTTEKPPAADKADKADKVVRPAKAPRQRRPRNWVTTLLGMAASFLLAVGLTSWIRDAQRAGGPGVVPSGQMAGVAGANLAGPSAIASRPGFAGVRPAPGRPDNVRVMGVVARDPGGVSQTVQLPAVALDRLDEDWLRSAPSAIPDGVSHAFQHAGHDVSHSRQLLPLRMKDGRRLMVPVDQLDIHYVNNPTYQ